MSSPTMIQSRHLALDFPSDFVSRSKVQALAYSLALTHDPDVYVTNLTLPLLGHVYRIHVHSDDAVRLLTARDMLNERSMHAQLTSQQKEA